MTHQFSQAPRADIARSTFDRSHGYKTTFDAANLVPIFVDEALPGDTFNLKANFFARLNTPIVPILDNLFFETFFFEVPVRQVWDNWAKFNGEQDNPGDSTDFLIPTQTSPSGGYAEESLQDYMGIPPGIADIEHSALFMRASNHIWNEWFRDQNLQPSIVVDRDDGPDDPADYILQQRGKRHDYFSSALPWPQKSDAGSVQIPLGGSAPVTSDAAIDPAQFVNVHSTVAGDQHRLQADGSYAFLATTGGQPLGNQLYADLSEATAATINQLRQSIAVQRLFEKDARGGTRYIEVIKNHWNVTSPDLRLQRPGYLGGGSSMVNISPVAQTMASASDVQTQATPQGNLAAVGTVNAQNHGFTKSFSEHTIIIGYCVVRADLTYQQGLNRMWSRQTRFDHYWPELSTIGEQSLPQKEIFISGVPAEDEVIFGYQERFAEYRYKPSLITGKMRSSSPTSLDVWHLSQDFANAPVLGDQFIRENPPIDRVIATPDEPQFKLDSYFSLKCARAMPMYGIPGLDKL
nr:MAG: major capsid protein [Microvirus sp.]